jgi:STE24 endopeptidase
MNVFAIVIFGGLLLVFVVQLVASSLSLSSVLRTPAESFAGLIDGNRYSQLQRYVRERTWLYIASEASYLGSLLLFWHIRGFPWLDDAIRRWSLGWPWTGLLVVGALFVARALVGLPFTIISVFSTEARFGFNKTSPGTFVGDLVKATLLSFMLGGLLLAAVLSILANAGRYSWVYGWIMVAGFFVLFQMAASHFIFPLFNRFTPVEDERVREVINSYTARAGFPLKAVSVMDASTRSSKTNAFLTGFGSGRRLVLQDTLLDRHSISEVVVVVAHEIGHYKLRHIPLRAAIEILQLGIFFLLIAFFLGDRRLYEAFYITTPSIYLGIVFCVLLYTPIEFVVSILVNWLDRHQEYEADKFAAETTGQPEAMAEALRKIAVENLTQLTPHPLDVVLNYSHPPLKDRIAHLQRLSCGGLKRKENSR